MIGKKDPFIQILKTATFTSKISDYAEKVQVSYDKMAIPKIGSQLKDLASSIDYQIKVNSTIKSLRDNKIHDSLSNKLKEICDLLDSKYSSRQFKEENSQKPSSPSINQEDKTEEPNPGAPKEDSKDIESKEEPKEEQSPANPPSADI